MRARASFLVIGVPASRATASRPVAPGVDDLGARVEQDVAEHGLGDVDRRVGVGRVATTTAGSPPGPAGTVVMA